MVKVPPLGPKKNQRPELWNLYNTRIAEASEQQIERIGRLIDNDQIGSMEKKKQKQEGYF